MLRDGPARGGSIASVGFAFETRHSLLPCSVYGHVHVHVCLLRVLHVRHCVAHQILEDSVGGSPGTFNNFREQVAGGCHTHAHANVTAILRRDSCLHAYEQRARCMDCARPSANL